MKGPRRTVRSALCGLVLALSAFYGSCYRAEIDLSPWLDHSPQGGEAAVGGSGESNGAACDDSGLDAAQEACRRGALPTRADCSAADVEGWSGCYDGGCTVCTKSVRDYPYYFDWHPCCIANDTCASSTPVKCNARCPAPTDHDKQKPCFVIEL